MVLPIAGNDAAIKALTSGLSLFGRKFKVQKYLSFGPYTQCNNCLAFGHHTCKCTNNTHCNLCAGEYPPCLNTCGHFDYPNKGKQCIHTTLQCSNCSDSHLADFTECPTILALTKKNLEGGTAVTRFIHEFPLTGQGFGGV